MNILEFIMPFMALFLFKQIGVTLTGIFKAERKNYNELLTGFSIVTILVFILVIIKSIGQDGAQRLDFSSFGWEGLFFFTLISVIALSFINKFYFKLKLFSKSYVAISIGLSIVVYLISSQSGLDQVYVRWDLSRAVVESFPMIFNSPNTIDGWVLPVLKMDGNSWFYTVLFVNLLLSSTYLLKELYNKYYWSFVLMGVVPLMLFVDFTSTNIIGFVFLMMFTKNNLRVVFMNKHFCKSGILINLAVSVMLPGMIVITILWYVISWFRNIRPIRQSIMMLAGLLISVTSPLVFVFNDNITSYMMAVILAIVVVVLVMELLIIKTIRKYYQVSLHCFIVMLSMVTWVTMIGFEANPNTEDLQLRMVTAFFGWIWILWMLYRRPRQKWLTNLPRKEIKASDYYKENPDMKEMHNTLLSMYDDFRKVCESKKIKLFAHAGTGIGALRDEGFIPWDDDIDMMITIEDYFLLESNLELFKKKGFEVILPDNKKARDFVIKVYSKSNPYFLDIFIAYPKVRSTMFSIKMFICFLSLSKPVTKNKLLSFLGNPIASIVSRKWIWGVVLKTAKNSKSDRATILTYVDYYWKEWDIAYKNINESKSVKFDKSKILIFKDFEKWLHTKYENIWLLPLDTSPNHAKEIEVNKKRCGN